MDSHYLLIIFAEMYQWAKIIEG